MYKLKIVSSLDKIFVDEKIDKFESVETISALRGERLSLQLLYTNEVECYDGPVDAVYAKLLTQGELAEYTSLRTVEQVVVTNPTNKHATDDNYLRLEPGVYPDILAPMRNNGKIVIAVSKLKSVWIEINIPKDIEAGEKLLSLTVLSDDGALDKTLTVAIRVIDAVMPESELYFTQWFHCDSLAQYYGVRVFSERHWEIIESFARCAVRNGINMLLTPTFTPPLDTGVGHERLTTQLVEVRLLDGVYSFGFELLDRWIDMCDRVGIKYLEIAHLFTQWGAYHAPKVMAWVGGEYRRIFGWETDAHCEEYREFLRAFIKAFLAHMKKRGDDKRCFFHISDEPFGEQLESYKASRDTVFDLLEGYTIMDALSDFEYYSSGVVKTAIPSNDHIKSFIEHGVPDLWTYYCCVQGVDVSNRFIAMPSYRTRSIGMQMYKFNIVGFLHWGFNFYNNRYSYDAINPFIDPSGDDFVPAGDMFSVYPAQDGTPLESIRLSVFFDALQDIAAMKLCEKYYSREEIVSEIEKIFGESIAFDKCARSAATMLAIRERINEMIATGENSKR